MKKKLKKKGIISLSLILLLIISIIIPILLIKHFSKPENLITLDFEYDDLCILGTDIPVKTFEFNITRNDVLFDTLYTNSLGQYELNVLDTADYKLEYSVKGIYYEIDLVESIHTEFIEIDTWSIKPEFIYDNMELVVNRTLDLSMYDGTSWNIITSVFTDELGNISILEGLPIGLYEFEQATSIFSIEQGTLDMFLAQVVITSIGITDSVIRIKLFNKIGIRGIIKC